MCHFFLEMYFAPFPSVHQQLLICVGRTKVFKNMCDWKVNFVEIYTIVELEEEDNAMRLVFYIEANYIATMKNLNFGSNSC